MSKILKSAAAAVVSVGLIVTAAAVPQTASAYDHYVCKYTQKRNEHTGTWVGALAGGLVGSQVSKHERGLGAVVGALGGAALGSKIGHDKGKSDCARRVAYRERVVYKKHGHERVVYRYVRR